MSEIVHGNPIVTEVYTSDPAVPVHDGRLHPLHRTDGAPPDSDRFVMRDWLCFSSDDLLAGDAHGSPLALADFAWASSGARAGAVVERDGRSSWFVAVTHATVDGGAIGVAVSDAPTGPFRDARGCSGASIGASPRRSTTR